MVTESEYSHVCVVWKDENGEPHVIEAVVPQVSVNPLTKYLDYGFYHIPTDNPMSKEEESYGLSKIGQKYSKIQAIEGYLNWLNVGDDTYWECAELTISMRRMSGANLGPIATPSAVVQKALSKGATLQFVERD
jgi:hypothetical protein